MSKFMLVNDTKEEIKLYEKFNSTKEIKEYLTEDNFKQLCNELEWDYNVDGFRIIDLRDITYYYYINNEKKWKNVQHNTNEYIILE